MPRATTQANNGASHNCVATPPRVKKTKATPVKLAPTGITAASQICSTSIWKNFKIPNDTNASAAPVSMPTHGPMNAANNCSSTRKKQHARIEASALVFIRRSCGPYTDDLRAILMPTAEDPPRESLLPPTELSRLPKYCSTRKMD